MLAYNYYQILIGLIEIRISTLIHQKMEKQPMTTGSLGYISPLYPITSIGLLWIDQVELHLMFMDSTKGHKNPNP